MFRRMAASGTWVWSILVFAFLGTQTVLSQGQMPSELMHPPMYPVGLSPEYKHSQNTAILNRLAVDVWSNGFECFQAYNTNLLIVQETGGYRFYNANDPSRLVPLGAIHLPSGYGPKDAEVVRYGDTTRLLLLGRRAGANIIIDVPYNSKLHQDLQTLSEPIDEADYTTYSMREHDLDVSKYIEMIYQHAGRLFLATNMNMLRWYDISSSDTWRREADIVFTPDTTCTLHPPSDIKNHEVKAWTRTDGHHLVGVGLVRAGMRILEFNPAWQLGQTVTQYYDHDRSLLPSTILNPAKERWDTTTYVGTNSRANKWDYRMCHSVLPYQHNGHEYVLTTDEFTHGNEGQDIDTVWIPGLWETIDFFMPNKVLSTYPVDRYFRGIYLGTDSAKSPIEHSPDRLNWLHRNHPQHIGVDPLRLQGSFLRIWDRNALGTNDTTINGSQVLLNAYDVQESDTRPEGYIGVNNIPELYDVPSGLHEPYLIGHTLYLAGYNSGARILRLDGSDISVRAYCRTEPFLENDTTSDNFYNRPDIIMYAKGIYRLVPDTNRVGIVFGSDLYNGMWVFRYFDSTLTDTLKHIPFQSSIRIGTIDPSNELTFHLAEGGAVIADSAVVEFVDNTHFKWDSWDSLVVNGELYVGSVTFDSTFAPSKLYCAGGGTIVLGGAGKTITGLRNIHVADGGTVIVRAGTTIEGNQAGTILVEGRLILESCLLGETYTILVRGNGQLDIDTGATVTGVQLITIADMDSRMILGPGSTVEMRPGAVIRASGIIETDPNSWCRLQAMGASPDSLVKADQCWFGLELDWQVDANTNIRNMFVHHGWPGIWVNDGSPTIADCQFSNNMIGLTLTQGAATVTDNTFRENALVGLNCHSLAYSAPSDNRINSNGNIGLNLQACTNHWYSNTLDSNLVGAMVYDNSSMTFNQWASQNPRTMCDTTHGNGIRFNTTGVGIQGNSSAEFQCDNSVYGNYDWSAGGGRDLSINDQCRIVGWGNYPDSIPGVTADTLKFLKVGSAILQWSDPSNWNPSPSTDPVLMKTTVSPFRAALARAQSAARQGLYQSAQTDFSLAATEAMIADEFLECLHSWRQMVVVTEQDSVNARAGSRNVYWTSMHTALTGNALYADSVWKRNISNEILSVELVRKRDTTQALNVLATLTGNGMPAEFRRRALLRSVYTYYCLMNDYASAMNRYQTIAQTYPGSLEQFEAKLILRLPIDSADVAALQKTSEFQNVHEHPTLAQPAWISIEGPAPNPATHTAAFTVRTERPVRFRIDVYDIAGKSWLTVFDGSLAGGMHRIPFDGSMLPAGVRLYRATGHDVESGAPVTIEGKFIVVR